MKEYVIVFKSTDTLVRELHEQQFLTLLACLMKAEDIPTLNPVSKEHQF